MIVPIPWCGMQAGGNLVDVAVEEARVVDAGLFIAAGLDVSAEANNEELGFVEADAVGADAEDLHRRCRQRSMARSAGSRPASDFVAVFERVPLSTSPAHGPGRVQRRFDHERWMHVR